MRLSPQQWILLGIWALCFVVTFIVVVYIDALQFATPKSVYALFEQIVAFYSAFLTPMLALAYARKARSVVSETRRSWRAPGFILALVLSLAWNSVFVFYVCRCAFTDRLDVPSLTEALQQLFGRCAWLLNPIVGFYFGSEP